MFAFRLWTHVSERGHVADFIDQHHSADFTRAREGKPQRAGEDKLDSGVLGAFSGLIVEAEVSTHAKMQNECATVIQSDDQVLAAPVCSNKTPVTKLASEGSRGFGLDQVGRRYQHALDSLSERGTSKIDESGFDLRKLRHNR